MEGAAVKNNAPEEEIAQLRGLLKALQRPGR